MSSGVVRMTDDVAVVHDGPNGTWLVVLAGREIAQCTTEDAADVVAAALRGVELRDLRESQTTPCRNTSQ